ncbi:MAG TPA: trypsin-like serine protease [Polyangiaceae bacterium]
MHRGLSWLSGAALALVGSACGAPPSEQIASHRQAILGGAVDSNDPAVVYILINGTGSTQTNVATGTIIAPHVVLTAAHVVNVFASSTYRIFTGPELDHDGGNPGPQYWLNAKETHADPGYNARVRTSGHDLALIILGDPTNIKPAPYNRAPADLSWIGRSIRSVGYGVTSPDDSIGESAGIRRQGATQISMLGTYFLSSMTGGEQPCGGDSGGPAFMDIDGVEAIVGVDSSGDASCAGSTFTRVDTSAAFIDQWIAQVDPDFLSDGGADAGPADPVDAGGSDDDGSTGAGGADMQPIDQGTDVQDSGGCAMGHGSSTAAWPWIALALAAVSRRARSIASAKRRCSTGQRPPRTRRAR